MVYKLESSEFICATQKSGRPKRCSRGGGRHDIVVSCTNIKYDIEIESPCYSKHLYSEYLADASQLTFKTQNLHSDYYIIVYKTKWGDYKVNF